MHTSDSPASTTPDPREALAVTRSTSDFVSNESRTGPYVGCQAKTRRGTDCHAFRRDQRPFCVAHDPEYRDTLMENVHRAGRASVEARKPHALAFSELHHFDLSSRHTLQVAIDAFTRLELTGALPANRSRTIARLLSLALRNLAVFNDATADGWDSGQHSNLSRALDSVLTGALMKAGSNDTARDTHELSMESWSRGQLAQDLERWPQLDKRSLAHRRFDTGQLPSKPSEYPGYAA